MSFDFDEYTEGWTAPIDYSLEHEHPVTHISSTFNASGMTPLTILRDKNGTVVALDGTTEWADASISKVRFNPGADDFQQSLSPYTLHWKVTDAAGKVATYPQGSPIRIKIYKQ